MHGIPLDYLVISETKLDDNFRNVQLAMSNCDGRFKY